MSTPAVGIARMERYTRQALHWGLAILPLVLALYAFGLLQDQPIGGAIGAIAGSAVAMWAGLVMLHTGLRSRGDLGPSGWDRWFYAPTRRGPATVIWAVASVATCVAAGFVEPSAVQAMRFVDSMMVSVVAATLACPVFGVTSRRAPVYLVAVANAVIWLVASTIVQPDAERLTMAFPVVIWTTMIVGLNSMLVNMLRTTQELDRLRHSSARLAVAEERLRFARDLHDVMGRTLSAVALKAELGAAQADRGRPEAARTMREVQAIATEALDEVRGLVRGYRETDLAAELAGARSLLESAGITVTTLVDAGSLPPAVARCLAWVVREGATNILRHATATAVELSLTRDADGVTLTLANDGMPSDERPAGFALPAVEARPDPANGGPRAGERPAGSGLAGLAERLDEVGGGLSSGERDGRWSLVAHVDAATLERLDTAGSQA